MLIEKLVLRVNMIKQQDVTTRQNNVVLFDYSSSAIHQTSIPSNTASNLTISHHYRCKITTESRKVLSLKIPQHYFFKVADQFLCKFNNSKSIN